MALETPSRSPPPFMANAILNFHFDYLTPSLTHFLLPPVSSEDKNMPINYSSQIFIFTGSLPEKVLSPRRQDIDFEQQLMNNLSLPSLVPATGQPTA